MIQQLQTSIEGETFPHRTLWICAKTLNKKARKEKKGSKYPDMAACLMAYLSYEAYLNILLSRLDQTVWENEREFFSKGKYRGTEGKLIWIAEFCGDFSWDRGSRPYQTIKKMSQLRNRMAHAKPSSFTEEIIHNDDDDINWWARDAFEEVNQDFVSRVLDDFEIFMEYVHESVKSWIKDPWLQAGALKGPGGYATSSTGPAP